MAKESVGRGHGVRGKLEEVAHNSVAVQWVATLAEEHNVVAVAAEVAGIDSDGEEPVAVEYLWESIRGCVTNMLLGKFAKLTGASRRCCGRFS